MTLEDFRELRSLAQADAKIRAIEQSACAGKFAFQSHAQASRANHKGRDVQPFRCPACSNWHLGSARTNTATQKAKRRFHAKRDERRLHG